MNVMLKNALVNINIWLILSMSIYFCKKLLHFIRIAWDIRPMLVWGTPLVGDIILCLVHAVFYSMQKSYRQRYNEPYISIFPCGIALFFSNGRFWLRTWHTDDDPSEGRNASGGSVSVLPCLFEFWYNFAFELSKPQNVLLLINQIKT